MMGVHGLGLAAALGLSFFEGVQVFRYGANC